MGAMVLAVSTYIDPGVVQGEVLVPGAINIATVPFTLGLAGVGSRNKRVTNETVLRGLVESETLTSIAGTPPHISSALANRAQRSADTSTVYKDGVALADSMVSFPAAFVEGNTLATRNLTTTTATNATVINALTLSLDGQVPVTMTFVDGASAVAISGTQINVTTSLGTAGAAATIAEIAAGINLGLAAAGALGYGAAYNAVATVGSSGLLITSPAGSVGAPTAAVSDVQILPGVDDEAGESTDVNGGGGTVALFAATTVRAATTVQINPLVFSAASTYTIDYVTTVDADDKIDNLANTGVQAIVQVGSFAGGANFTQGTDYAQASNTVSFTIDAAATLDAVPASYDVSTNDRINISLNGRAAVEIDLNGLASPPLGYINPTTPATALANELAANINAVLNNSSTYGAAFNSVAAAVTVGADTFIRLTTPDEGDNTSITFFAPSATDATTAIFGIQTTQYPYTVLGTGKKPALATNYYVSYDITRPTSDYNVQKRFFNLDAARAEIGPTTDANPLMIATEIAFANGAPSVVVSQVNDVSAPQFPTRGEFQAALNAFKSSDTVTELVVLSTDLAVQTDLKDHIETESSPTEKHYRRGYFGMARSTAYGDRNTPSTFVYMSANTLQFGPQSSGRGRAILVAPPQEAGVSRDITLEDGSVVTVNLDSTYMAAAVAARLTSFTSPASTLAKQTVTGFNLTDITAPWEKPERHAMASEGVTVVTFDAGNFVLLDPITTERAGGAVVTFEQISAGTQKDNVTRKIDRALDANIVGIVPTDLADFLIDIKLVIKAVLTGEIGNNAIGPYRNADGTTRQIEISSDIQVEQRANNPTEFDFRYFYNLRLPALRLFGEYSVDNPFFA